MGNKIKNPTGQEIEDALIDVLWGNRWYDIQNNTGFSKERCVEIENIFINLVKYRKNIYRFGQIQKREN